MICFYDNCKEKYVLQLYHYGHGGCVYKIEDNCIYYPWFPPIMGNPFCPYCYEDDSMILFDTFEEAEKIIKPISDKVFKYVKKFEQKVNSISTDDYTIRGEIFNSIYEEMCKNENVSKEQESIFFDIFMSFCFSGFGYKIIKVFQLNLKEEEERIWKELLKKQEDLMH